MNAAAEPFVALSDPQFESLFPFHVVADEQLRIIRAGASFRRLCPDIALGTPLTACFALKRPLLLPSFESLCRAEGELLLWQRIGSELTLRGHLLNVGGRLLILWSPWLTDTAEIGRYGLAVDDFPLQDPVIDLLHVVKSHAMALADVRALADKLTVQRAQLRAANAELSRQCALLQETQLRLEAKEAEARKLALIASRTDNGVILTDANGRTEWVNEGFTRMTGYAVEEIRGKTPGSLLQGPATDSATVAMVQARLRGGQGFRCELLNYHKSGREYWVAIEVQPIHDEAGRVVNFMGIETDITERRLSAAALEASETRYRELVGSLREVVFQTDASGRLTFLNPAWTRMTGLRVDESLGKTIVSFLHPDDRTRFRRMLAKLFERDGTAGFLDECRLKMYLQRYGWVEFSAHPSTDRSGVTGTLNDITERRKAAQIMLDAARAAEAANRAKSEFLATMSHEIRTPMNGVLGMAELLSYTELRADQRELVETIRTSGSALLRIINDILDFSKVEAGTISLEEDDFELKVLLEEALDVVRPEARRKGLTVGWDCDARLAGTLRGDAGRLRQIVLNLLGNAVKFTDSGEVALRAIRLNPHRELVTVRVEVVDTGPGIAEREQTCLFQPFSQCDARPSRRFGGTGLGLAISRKLVQLMGGDIGVDSTPGKGSCFWFQLTLVPAQKAAARADLNLFHGTRVYLAIGPGEVRDALESALASWAVACQPVATLAEALEACVGVQSDGDHCAIILVVPGQMSIPEALSFKSCACARLVLVTDPGDLPDEHDELDELVDAYLVTPANRSQLFDCLTALLPGPGNGAMATAAPDSTLPPEAWLGTSGRRVLLVEDNEVNRRVASMMLEKLAYTVDCAENGSEALERMQHSRYAVVFMDCQMPVMDGFEATQAIRRRELADPRLGHAYIVAITANALHGDRELCLQAGMDDYVSKPLSVQKLGDALARGAARRADAVIPAPGVAADMAEPRGDAPPRFDPAALDGLLHDLGAEAETVLEQILDVFFNDTAASLEDLKRAVASSDLARVGRVAHRLKGSCGQIGARALAQHALVAEGLAAECDSPGLNQLLAVLESEWQATKREVGCWRGSRCAPKPVRADPP